MNDYQKRIYYAEKLYDEKALSNIGGVLSFDDDVNIGLEELCEIVKEIINKTVSLRLRLSSDLELYEYVYDNYAPDIVLLDSDYEGVLEYAGNEMRIAFEEITDSPLFLVKVIDYRGRRAIFFKLHHILGDSVSIQLLAHNVEDGINALKNGKKYICENTAAEYTAMDVAKKAAAGKYFSERMEGYSPVRIARKEDRFTEAAELRFSTHLFRKHMTEEFLAAVYMYLSEILDVRRLAFGFVMANRSRQEMGVIGMYANTLPLMIDYDGDSFTELRKKIKSDVFKLIRYGSFVPEEDKKRNPYEISISYRYEDYLPDISIGRTVEMFNGHLDVPMRISAEEIEDELRFSIFYKTGLYEEQFIRKMGASIIHIIQQEMDGSDNLSDVDILTDNDRNAWKELNNTAAEHVYRDVIGCFTEHVKKNADNISLSWDSDKSSITMEELYRYSHIVAEYLEKRDGSRIGINIPRCPEMMAAVLGTLMAGKSFIILSEDVPRAAEFADIILEKAEVSELLAEEVRDSAGIVVAGTDPIEDLIKLYENRAYDPESTAYMICTSGSTGEPKCIEISRGSLISRLEWQDKVYGLSGRIMQKTVNTFDVSVWEMMSVVFGASLCLMNPGDEKYPDRIVNQLDEYKVQKVHFVPTMLAKVLEYINKNHTELPALKEIYLSGEKLERNLMDCCFRVLPDVRLINFYGPAECTIDVTHYECSRNEDSWKADIPIGRPVDNTEIYIMNSRGKCLPPGVVGEICISGELVGKGYLGASENQYGGYTTINDQKFFRTGDLGELGFDGNIYIYGRRDNQIKLRGMRIDLSGIKEIVLKAEGVHSAEVIKNNNRLECYIVGDTDISELRKRIASEISVYAVPSVFRKVEEIPFGTNQKLDRDRLISMDYVDMIDMIQTKKSESAADDKDVIQDILSEVSRYIPAGPDDNLFEYGLDSISVIDITTSLQDKGYNISFGDFYENLTVRSLAGNLKNKKYFTYLKRKPDQKRVMICFPFAGGEPQNFSRLADKLDMDVIGIYISSFSENASIRQIASRLTGILNLDSYEEIIVFGQCVGSYIAMEFASRLERGVREIILVAPSVRTEKNTHRPGITPWRLMNDSMITGLLRKAGGSYKYNKQIIRRFRVDTDRYFNYTHEDSLRKRIIRRTDIGNIKVVFGTKDIFTAARNALIRKIEYLMHKEIKVYDIRGGKHFMNEDNIDELTEIINNH